MKKATGIVMLLSLLTFAVCGGILYVQNHQDAQSAASFQMLSQEIQSLTNAKAEGAEAAVADVQADPIPTLAPEERVPSAVNPAVDTLPATEDAVLLAYREKARENTDLVGWLSIEGTVIDYPVMRSPDEAERYLHRGFDGRYGRAGTPFMLPISDPAVPNDNIIIYAHHMKDGSMFGELPKYETLAGYEAQPYIQFDTLTERATYKIIAVFRTSLTSENLFPYYEYEWLDDEETFDRYMRGVMANRLYDTGETAVFGDQLLSLSTCDYHEPDGRLVVVAKKVMPEMEENDHA